MKRSLGYAFGDTYSNSRALPMAQYLDLDIPSLYQSWGWAILDQNQDKIRVIEHVAKLKEQFFPEIQQLIAFSGQNDVLGFFKLVFGMSFEDLNLAQKQIIRITPSCSYLRRLFDFRYVPIDMEAFKLIAEKPDEFTTSDDFTFIISHLTTPFSHEHVLEAMASKCSESFLWLLLPNLNSCPPDLLRAAMIMCRSIAIISAVADLVEYVESSDITFAQIRGYPEEIISKLSGAMKKFLIALGVLLEAVLLTKRSRPGSFIATSHQEAKTKCIDWNPVFDNDRNDQSHGLEHVELLLRVTRSKDLTDFFTQLNIASDTEVQALMFELVKNNMDAARLLFSIRSVSISESIFFQLSHIPDEMYRPGDVRLFKYLGFELTPTHIYSVIEQGCPDWFLLHSLRHLGQTSVPVQVLYLAMLQGRRNQVLLDILKRIPHPSMDDLHFARRNNIDSSIIEALMQKSFQ